MEGTATTQIERSFVLRAEKIRKRSISAIKCGINGIDRTFLDSTAREIAIESDRLAIDIGNWLHFKSVIDEPERERRETSDALESVTIRALRELRLALHIRRDILRFDELLKCEDRNYTRATTEILSETVDLALHRYKFDMPFDEQIEQRILTGDEYIDLLKKVYVLACAFSDLIDQERIFAYRPLQRVLVNDLFSYLLCEIRITSHLHENWGEC
jgi:hypothetical protein